MAYRAAGIPVVLRRVRTLLVVISLVAIAAVTWWMRGAALPLGGTRTGVASQPIGRAPDGPLAMAALPGMPTNYEYIRTFNEIPTMNVLTPEEVAAYRSGGTTGARLAISELPGATLLVLLVRLHDHPSAVDTAHRLSSIERDYGLTTVLPTPVGVAAATVAEPNSNQKWLIRAHYVHADVVARIEVHGSGWRATAGGFDQALDAETWALRPDA